MIQNFETQMCNGLMPQPRPTDLSLIYIIYAFRFHSTPSSSAIASLAHRSVSVCMVAPFHDCHFCLLSGCNQMHSYCYYNNNNTVTTSYEPSTMSWLVGILSFLAPYLFKNEHCGRIMQKLHNKWNLNLVG